LSRDEPEGDIRLETKRPTRIDQGLKRRFSESHHREAILMLRPIELQADLARLSTL
jgi:hypothetical protein